MDSAYRCFFDQTYKVNILLAVSVAIVVVDVNFVVDPSVLDRYLLQTMSN
jgi:hypothetical protein